MDIPLLPSQKEVLFSEAKYTAFVAGIGNGKSHIGALWVIKNAVEAYNNKWSKPTPNGRLYQIICANTYSQLMLASADRLIQQLEELKIPYKAVLSGSKKRISFLNCDCYLYSLEKYDNIRGVEVNYIWADEMAFSCKEALDVLRGRLRGKITPYLRTLITTSPNGYNFVYDIFENTKNLNDDDKKLYKKNKLVRGQTKDNIFLPKGYYEELLEDYGGIDSPLAQQELFGQFVSLSEGAIYWGFKRADNVVEGLKINPSYPVYVGVDFNVSNMSAVYCQLINNILYVIREVKLKYENAGTYELSGQIVNDLKGYNVFIIPDSTGKNRSASSFNSESNLQIMRDMGLRVMETRNPKIRSRQTTMNSNMKLKKTLFDSSCKELIKEIETLNARESEGLVSHLAVCVGYVDWKLRPLKREVEEPKFIQM